MSGHRGIESTGLTDILQCTSAFLSYCIDTSSESQGFCYPYKDSRSYSRIFKGPRVHIIILADEIMILIKIDRRPQILESNNSQMYSTFFSQHLLQFVEAFEDPLSLWK